MNKSEAIGSFHFNESLTVTGGAEEYISNIYHELIKTGESIALASGRDERFAYPNSSYYIPQTNFSPTSDERISNEQTATHISEIMCECGLGLVHLHNIANLELFRIVNNKYPVVKTVHDYRSICPTEFHINHVNNACTIPMGVENCQSCNSSQDIRIKVEQLSKGIQLLTGFDLLITGSNYVKDQLKANGIPEDKVRVIPFFTPAIDVSPNELTDNRYASDLLFVGRIIREKGVRELIETVGQMQKQVTLTICGNGPDLDYCKKLAQSDKLDDRIKFVGWTERKQLLRYYWNTKIVMVPSIWPEPFCLVGLEAMQMGKPIIAFSSGGINEWLEDNENGFLVEPGNSRAMADKVDYLIKHPLSAIRMGEIGAKILKEKFSIDQHVHDLTQTYREIGRI